MKMDQDMHLKVNSKKVNKILKTNKTIERK